MVRILYGVSGEGSGHSSRARVVARHLLAAGHEVLLASYDRGFTDLSQEFEVQRIEGLTIGTINNRVSVVKTFTENLARLSDGVASLRALRRRGFEELDPQVVITDFEPMTAHLAGHFERPLLSLDNQHRFRYMSYPCPRHLKKDGLVTESVVRMMVPRPTAAFVTTFWFGATRSEKATLFPPLLRREVLATAPREGEHVLVYFTKAFDDFLPLLRERRRERFLVYGTGREGEEGNLVFKPFSRDGFLADLASARAVIATAGFTLLTEALYLRKPLLALPMAGQFEQELNALLLEEGGLGRNGRKAGPETVGDFLYRLPDYRAALEARPHEGNERLLGALDELLADGAARLEELRVAQRA